MAQHQHSSKTPVMPDAMAVPGSTTLSAASAPHPLDGSQFHNVIEEQSWSELPPTPEEQMPWRALHREQRQEEPSSHQEPPQISVGPA